MFPSRELLYPFINLIVGTQSFYINKGAFTSKIEGRVTGTVHDDIEITPPPMPRERSEPVKKEVHKPKKGLFHKIALAFNHKKRNEEELEGMRQRHEGEFSQPLKKDDVQTIRRKLGLDAPLKSTAHLHEQLEDEANASAHEDAARYDKEQADASLAFESLQENSFTPSLTQESAQDSSSSHEKKSQSKTPVSKPESKILNEQDAKPHPDDVDIEKEVDDHQEKRKEEQAKQAPPRPDVPALKTAQQDEAPKNDGPKVPDYLLEPNEDDALTALNIGDDFTQDADSSQEQSSDVKSEFTRESIMHDTLEKEESDWTKEIEQDEAEQKRESEFTKEVSLGHDSPEAPVFDDRQEALEEAKEAVLMEEDTPQQREEEMKRLDKEEAALEEEVTEEERKLEEHAKELSNHPAQPAVTRTVAAAPQQPVSPQEQPSTPATELVEESPVPDPQEVAAFAHHIDVIIDAAKSAIAQGDLRLAKLKYNEAREVYATADVDEESRQLSYVALNDLYEDIHVHLLEQEAKRHL